MEIYLSPIYVILAGIFIVGIFHYTKMPVAVIASIAGALCIYTLYLHVSMYSSEYRLISTGAWIRNLAPTLLIIIVVLMSISYIIYFLKGGKSSKNNINYEIETPKLIKPRDSLKGQNTSRNLTDSEHRNYISALDRLI